LPVAVLGLILLASGTIGVYVKTYMTTYAVATLHMRANVAFAATVVVGLCGVAFDLVSGALSDRIGRKPMMLVPGILLLVSILPAFYVISHYRTTATLLGATAVLSILASLCVCPMIIWLTESLPAAIRSSRNPLAPAWYWTAAAIVGVAAMIATHESAPRKLAAPEALLVQLPDEIADEAP
jgi:MFS transporter, MHS family, citrate/tricarballylate:H+ symporter